MAFQVELKLYPLCKSFEDYKVFIIRSKDSMRSLIEYLLINHRNIVNYKIIELR